VIEIASSIRALAASTDAWLVDIWGVMHNGIVPFAPAVEACRAYREGGGHVVLVSNAPRPHGAVMAALDRIGVAREAYDAIISSGDTSRALIAALGNTPFYHLGPDRDLALYDGLDVVRVAGPGAAMAIVCTGLFDDHTETAETYAPLLSAWAARGLHMICANPDLTVERGGRIIPCAGAVAAAYVARGGHVDYAGKPHLPIYQAAFALLEARAGRQVPMDRILAIGDGIRTDIAGAARAGIRSVYIASGVHLTGALDTSALARLFPDTAGRPVAAMTGLAW
jgi:HAD superfamily hydrolase (TIGR01459 family)